MLDHVDWDDDNDGILEGPIDYTQGNDPTNVSGDRYVEPGTVHPWTGTAVGVGYKIDQNLWDHDNDGVPDEDMDGSGRVSYDEDDDNDARIDQFTWPCDNDGDGAQDYFDDDDDGDGVLDWEDANPYDASISGQMSTSGNMYDVPVLWQFSDYMQYSGGLNFVTLEASFHPGNPAFTTIWDGGMVTWMVTASPTSSMLTATTTGTRTTSMPMMTTTACLTCGTRMTTMTASATSAGISISMEMV
ncbi:MAG: hypothetical protein CXX71_00710 [Methanobacteriota archaeon]|nr:MAG: hypothetical protein CXX71_00710 [Euryarchaeota archaeon]